MTLRSRSRRPASRMLWLALAIPLVLTSGARADVLEVPGGFATIQAALSAASTGDEIVVSEGTWIGPLDFLGKDVVLRSVAGPVETILDADGSGSVLSFSGGESSAARVEGFTITGGSGTAFGTTIFGGGVYLNGSSPTLVGNVIEFNRAQFGGAVACLGGAAPEIRDCVLRSNVAEVVTPVAVGRGGALFAEQSFPALFDCRIEENFAEFRGGGIHAEFGSVLLVEDSEFVRNTTLIEGGAIALMDDSDGNLRNNVFRENRADTRGGAVHVQDANARFEGNRFSANVAGFDGGAISLMNGTDGSEVLRNRIEGNRADRSGGGILVHGARALLAGNVIAFNHAGNPVEGAGGALMAAVGGQPQLVNETYFANTTERGGAAIHAFGLSRVNVVNSILWNEAGFEGEIVAETASRVLVTASIVRGGWAGEGNLSLDPRFVDGPAGVFEPRLDSPAVDAGVSAVVGLPDTDLDGDPRVVDGARNMGPRVDLGAQELRPGVAVRFGTTGSASGRVHPVLSVNGSSGDRERRLVIRSREPITVDLVAPRQGPVSAPFVLYAWEGEPDAATLSPLPLGVGTLGFRGPLDGGRPRRVWNNLGHRPRLGFPDLPSTPAPSRAVDAPGGIGLPIVFYLQGIIADEGSEGSAPVSVTNGVVVEVRL